MFVFDYFHWLLYVTVQIVIYYDSSAVSPFAEEVRASLQVVNADGMDDVELRSDSEAEAEYNMIWMYKRSLKKKQMRKRTQTKSHHNNFSFCFCKNCYQWNAEPVNHGVLLRKHYNSRT
jgi:hypothetical protein